ncbi:hypothetical protein ACFL6R_05300 [Gemmatimonadota bacterium]
MQRTPLFVAASFLGLMLQIQVSPDLEQPFIVTAGDEPIDVDMGHAAPCFSDIDGDDLPDLLVGQFGEGKLRIYRNVGTRMEPRFGDYNYLQAAGADGTVPSS